MYDQHAFGEENVSVGIFDFGNENQIVYQISNGDVISMTPTFIENKIQIGIYGIAPSIIEFHIPDNIMSNEQFFSSIIDNDTQLYLETTSVYHESFGMSHVKIELFSPSWHEGEKNEHFEITLSGKNLSKELLHQGKKISTDTTILKKFNDTNLGFSFFYPEDMNPVVDKSKSTVHFHVSKKGYNFVMGHTAINSELGNLLSSFLNENGHDNFSSWIPSQCSPECDLIQLKIEKITIGKSPSLTYLYEHDFIEKNENENFLNKIGMFSIIEIEDEYVWIHITFNDDSYYDGVSRNAVILNSLDIGNFIEKQISENFDLKKKFIHDPVTGIEFSKPSGWEKISHSENNINFLEFEIKDYYSNTFPYVTVSTFNDSALQSIDNLKSAEEYFSNFEFDDGVHVSEISDVSFFYVNDARYISKINKTFDKNSGLLLFVEKSILFLHDDGKIIEFNLGAEADSFLRVIDEFDHMITTLECCDVKEDNSDTNDASSKEIQNKTDASSKEIQNKTDGGGCLIATAAFGSEMAPQVQFLRELRDNTVLTTQSGTAFMTGFNQFYYSFSPAIADYERENPVFKEAVKVTLTPMLTSLTLLNYVDVDTEEEMLGYGIGIILLNIGMYFVAPAVLIVSLKKRLFI